ncbi:hypothetical protein JTM59_34810, partial [Pseudomonas aeruginosa]|nr:hypothetical protein [Pseudomonas aeruginosa]
ADDGADHEDLGVRLVAQLVEGVEVVLVGQGVAAAAKAFGGQVMVAEIDPARRLQAAYDGWHVVDLQEAIASADVVATATGGKNVVNRQALDRAKAG